MVLTIIIPVYNEIKTINAILDKILSIKNIKKQIILVDDFSTDGTREIIKKSYEKKINKVVYHKNNLGKGAAIISAKKHVNGDIVIIQDADLEYNPKDYLKIIKPIINKKVQVVYGSRVLGKNRYSSKNFTSKFRIFSNHVLTVFSNFLYNQKLTDAHTCYKEFNSDLFKKINLKEKDFAFCPEVTAKISKKKIKIFEVPISYKGRSYKEGKKISFFDGLRAILVLLKYKFNNDV